MNRNEYLKFRRPYDRVLRQLLLELDFFIEDALGINVYSIHHRLKSFKSASKKAAGLNLPITELQDIAGLRVVVATFDEIDVIARFFSRKADSKDLIIKSDERIENKQGYRARHVVVEFEGHYSRSVRPARVEVQIQTLLQHAFNYISRSWVYKTERAFSNEWRKEFLQLSRDLAELDTRIANLQKQVVESSVSGSDEEPLTPFSYQRVVADIFGEYETIDNAVDYVRMLVDLQCDTNGKLRSFFGDPAVLRLRERFAELQNKIGKTIIDIPMHQFWMIYGVRLEAAEGYLQVLAATSQ